MKIRMNTLGMGSIGVLLIVRKVKENRLIWFGHVMRRNNLETVRFVYVN